MIELTINGNKIQVEDNTTYLELAKRYQGDYENDIVLCLHDNRLKELGGVISAPGNISFITTKSAPGNETYKRSVVFLFMKCLYDIVGKENIKNVWVHFSVSKGYYIETEGLSVNQELLDKIENRMIMECEKDIAITKKTLDVYDAIRLFSQYGMCNKERLLRYRMSSKINIYEMDGYVDYFYGYMVPSTGYLKYFKLYKYRDGLVLQLPNKAQPTTVLPFEPQEKVTEALLATTKWSKEQSVRSVADLNEHIVNKTINDLILVQETHQNQKLSEIALEIKKRGNIKFVMIAGPSSSGKTSFSHRLSIQLRAQGFKPHPIACDDYYLEREKCPKDENGEYNFEDLDSIDVEEFNSVMSRLLNGEEVMMPSFNFKTGHREYKGDTLKLGEDDILIIEGIHCLNPSLYPTLPQERMFKVYISALTQLNVDEHNRVATTDGRLIRRMARDAAKRGTSATETIQRWDSVRRGEEKNIFPYQESADVVFNSTLCYELPALKVYAEPLLFSVPTDSEYYTEAKRLLKFLSYFLALPSDNIPHDSILREFVGGSIFPV